MMPLKFRSCPSWGWVFPDCRSDCYGFKLMSLSWSFPDLSLRPLLSRGEMCSDPILFFIFPCSVIKGWDFSFVTPTFSHERQRQLMLVFDSTQKTRPWEHLTCEHPGLVLSLIVPALVMKQRVLVILGLHLSKVHQKGHGKQAFSIMFCGMFNFVPS